MTQTESIIISRLVTLARTETLSRFPSATTKEVEERAQFCLEQAALRLKAEMRLK